MGTWEPGPGVIELPDGRRLRGRGLRRRGLERHALERRGRVQGANGPDPEFGVYLLGRRPDGIEWPHRWVRWPDFRTPADTDDAVAALREAHERAARLRVEVACGGGIGRTGTALALIATFAGVAPADAVGWVRRYYHRRAVETPWQRRWVERTATRG